MRVELVLPGALDAEAGLTRRLALDVPAGSRVREVLDALDAGEPVLGRRLRDETGALRRHVNVFVGGDDVRGLLGQDTPVGDGASVLVLPNVAGG